MSAWLDPNFDHMADYRAAQEAGHHPDCDGYRTAHRVTAVRSEHGTWAPFCEDGCDFISGSFSTRERALEIAAGHAEYAVPCDFRCREWDAARASDRSLVGAQPEDLKAGRGADVP